MDSYDEINKPDKVDIAMAGLRATMNLLPGASFFDQYWATFLSTPLELRRASWFQELYERVKYLEEHRGIDISTLPDNPQFIDALLKITPLVQANSQNEKRQAFKNALTNIAIKASPGQTKTHLFLRLVDVLSVDHIRVLQFIDNPEKWCSERGITMPYFGGSTRSLPYIMNKVHCDVGDETVANMIFVDLYNNSLTASKIHTQLGSYTATDAARSQSSSIGREFLEFITFEETQK